MGVDIACLEQAADKHAHALKSKQAMTRIKNMGLVWSFIHYRLLHPLEILGLMGFPTFSQLAPFGETCTFRSSRESHALSTSRTRRSMCGQAGNSMYVPLAGIALLFYCLGVWHSEPMKLAELAARSHNDVFRKRRRLYKKKTECICVRIQHLIVVFPL